MTAIDYDTEFLEDGNTIALISIGMVAGTREYYAVTDDYGTMRRAVDHPWLRGNVIPSLPVVLRDHAGGNWQLEETLVKLGRAEAERDALRRRLDNVKYALEEELEP